ncbi:MAG: DMT family transporter [Bacteroidaceae bacterium]|nr:DMT family transporter [Prevotellaceae bacterium]MDY2850413.1 DMT family transporter [Bacteroidaceae bacterium]
MWIAFAFLSAILLGFYDVSKKISLKDNAIIPVLFLNTLFCSLLFVPFIALSGNAIGSDAFLYVPQTSLHEQVFIMLKAVIVLSSWILGYKAIKHLPLTIVGPINATRPVMVLVGALLLYGERLNLWQWAGVALSIVSFFMLSRSGRKEGIKFSHNKWIAFLIAAAVLGACSGLYDRLILAPVSEGGLGLHRMTVQAYYNFYQCILMFIAMLTMWLPKRRSSTPLKWHWAIPVISIFLSAADLAYFYALTKPDAMIAVVSMIRRGSVVVSFCIGSIFLHEKNLRSKFTDVILILLSMLMLYLGSK